MKKYLFLLVSLIMSVSVFGQDYMSGKWRVFVDAGMGTFVHGTGDYHAVLVGGSVTVGHQFTDCVNVGLGIAPVGTVDSWGTGGQRSFEIPVYAQIRLDDMNKKVSPFGQLRLGAAFGEHNTKAFQFNIGAGVRICHFTVGAEFVEDINHGSVGYVMGKIGLVF